MTRVAIVPVADDRGAVSYRAVAGDKHSDGTTAGAALDALAAQLPEGECGALVIVRMPRSDARFDASRQHRLEELMGRWRKARDRGAALPAAEQAELDDLVDVELRASAARAAALADEAGR